MAAALAPLVTAAGFVAYFLVTTKLGIYWRVPWPFLLVMAGGVALGVVALARRRTLGRAAGALASVGILAFACHELFVASMLGPREERPAVGDAFPDFSLPASDGGTYHLADGAGRRRLLVLYRGAW